MYLLRIIISDSLILGRDYKKKALQEDSEDFLILIYHTNARI